MYFYYLTRPLQLRTREQSKYLPAAAKPGAPAATEVYVAAQREVKLIHQAIRQTYPDTPPGDIVRLLAPAMQGLLPGVPPRLGAEGLIADGKAGADCLTGQLQALRAAQPDRRHFRLLLVNGFGANLGDNLVGLTAFRHVLPVLQAHLPDFSVDVLLGWHSHDELAYQFQGLQGVDTVHTQGLTLAELGRYQALFDTSNLIEAPRYGELPMVDWYLWWMGVDYGGIAPEAKRNMLALRDADRGVVAARLAQIDAGPRILINPKASVPLRSMPEPALHRLVARILSDWPTAQIVLVQSFDVEHPRIHVLDDVVNTPGRLAALTAAVDALIGVDTYTQHLADATATPAVTICTTMGAELFPYYPLHAVQLLPRAEALAGWGRPKVPDAEWPGMAEDYACAWQELEPGILLEALRRVMARKAADPEAWAPRFRSVAAAAAAVALPQRRREDPLAGVLDEVLGDLAAQVLRAGDTVVHLGPGEGVATLGLAQAVGHHGRLIAIEPRRVLHQQLCARLVQAGCGWAEVHLALPEGAGLALREIQSLRTMDEYRPLMFANSRQPEPVVCWPLDTLNLDVCALLVIYSPLALCAVLEGARDTLVRLRPVVLIGVLEQGEFEAFESWLTALDYRVRILLIGPAAQAEQQSRYGLLVAEPVAGRPACSW
ncbi:MAG: hypothetical protein JSR83_14385 [Proteobacteria bacterium]|nr:hypothetical protein [Pseudomonadota bacterium]